MRLIDADALIASIHGSIQELRNIYEMLEDGEKKIICNSQIVTLLETLFRVREQPTVDADQAHGRWILVRDRFGNAMGSKCSECGRRVRNHGENYCPNCGADMREGKDDGN